MTEAGKAARNHIEQMIQIDGAESFTQSELLMAEEGFLAGIAWRDTNSRDVSQRVSQELPAAERNITPAGEQIFKLQRENAQLSSDYIDAELRWNKSVEIAQSLDQDNEKLKAELAHAREQLKSAGLVCPLGHFAVAVVNSEELSREFGIPQKAYYCSECSQSWVGGEVEAYNESQLKLAQARGEIERLKEELRFAKEAMEMNGRLVDRLQSSSGEKYLENCSLRSQLDAAKEAFKEILRWESSCPEKTQLASLCEKALAALEGK